MKITELLVERITLDNNLISNLYTILMKWRSTLKDSRQQLKTNDSPVMIKSLYKKDIERVQQLLYPTIINSIKSNFSGELQLDFNISPKGNARGSIGEYWKNTNGILTNDLKILFTYDDYFDLVNGGAPHNIFNPLIDTFTHEITHLIQSLRNPKFTATGKDMEKVLGKDNWGDKEDAYWGNTAEIDAYAQSFVTTAILNNQIQDVINTLRTANTTDKLGLPLFSSDTIFPYKQYNRLFANNDSKIRSQIWKRFNKKVYEKIIDYLNHNN